MGMAFTIAFTNAVTRLTCNTVTWQYGMAASEITAVPMVTRFQGAIWQCTKLLEGQQSQPTDQKKVQQ